MTTTTSAAEATVHPFERAGLGAAPFRYVGSEYRVGPIITANADGTETHVGAPGQPMGSCRYCGQGIAECCVIVSADGRRFTVGNECVYKTGDGAMVKAAKRAHNERASKQRAARAAERIGAARARLDDEGVRAALASQPHPRAFVDRATGRALTLLDWAAWMLAHAGRAGKLDAARAIECAAEVRS